MKRKTPPAKSRVASRKTSKNLVDGSRLAQAVEAALRQSEERFRLVMDHANDAIICLDLHGTIQWASLQTTILTGRLMTELIGTPVMSVLTPEAAVAAEARLAAVRRGEAVPPLVEFEILRPDGTQAVVEANITSVQGAEGVAGRLLVLRDITERKQAEIALQESAAHHRAILNSAMDAVITITQQGRVVEFNPAAEVMFGYARGAVLGKEMVELIIPPALRERHRMGMARYLSTGTAAILGKRVEITAMHADGVEFPVELTVTLIVLAGEPFFTAFIRDITARKLAEQDRLELYERLQASHNGLRMLSRRLMEVQDQERRHLAREMHDEIGQALTAAKINVQQALRLPASSDFGMHLAESVRILDHALQQVRSLALDLRPSLLDDLGLVPTLKWLAERHSKTSEITVTVSAEPLDIRPAPEIEITCYRVAQEALTNAARHAKANRISIELTRLDRGIVLSIQDDGIGFDAPTTLSRASAGESIGLLGMQERVILAGGEIDFSSSPGKGTEIRAWFPLAESGPSSGERA